MVPRATRPYMPGYGTLGPDEGTGLLPWAWAEARIAQSHDYWLATAWPDGRPHVMPVWGVWLDEALWVSASGASRKAKNIDRDPRCTATTDDARNPLVVEGLAHRVVDEGGIARFTAAVNAKYESDYSIEFFTSNACIRITPVRAFGLAEDDFTGSPTRWEFTPPGNPPSS